MFEVVVGMPESPQHCLHCGSNNLNSNGTQKRSIFSSGVDINWGDSVYTCWECAELIADLIDREPRESYEKLLQEKDELQRAHNELTEQHEEAKELLDRIRDGADARKKVLAGSSSSSKSSE